MEATIPLDKVCGIPLHDCYLVVCDIYHHFACIIRCCRYTRIAHILEQMQVDVRILFQCRLGLFNLASGALAQFQSTVSQSSSGVNRAVLVVVGWYFRTISGVSRYDFLPLFACVVN